MNGFAEPGIQVVSKAEILLEKAIFRSTQNDLDLTEPKVGPGESMGFSDGPRPPAYTKQTIFEEILLNNLVRMALQPMVFKPFPGPEFDGHGRLFLLHKQISI